MTSETAQGLKHHAGRGRQQGLVLVSQQVHPEPAESVITIDAALEPLLPRMRQLLDEHIRLLRVELDQGGFEAMRSNARALTKLARRFELRRVAELCRKLEALACAELENEARRCLIQLETFVSRCRFVCGKPRGAASPAGAV